ncbi:MAG TPA: glycosyltransferase 87 family protein [Pyrinomonadaceae bacterium]|nr:glycosyltransferase 87 family protein [Pyrinomonadaceae bacterium]
MRSAAGEGRAAPGNQPAGARSIDAASRSFGASRTFGAAARAFFTPANVLLIALGVALLVLFRHVLGLPPGTVSIWQFVKLAFAQCALLAAAGFVAWRAPSSRHTLLVVLAFAALFRYWPLVEEPRLSDDIYRYVWDGRVQAAGINPYRHIPAEEPLAHLRDEAIYPKINRRDYAPTIYPPLAQAIFFATTRVSESVTWMKLTMIAFEAVSIWAVVWLLASFGLPRQRVLLFAWHPLLVYEIAGSGHLDALMICFVCLALVARRSNREGLTGALLACAALVKFFPAVLAPALYRRWGWRMPAAFAAVFALAYVPYLSVGLRRVLGFLPDYTNEEGLQNGVRFFILTLARKVFGEALPSRAYVLFALAVLAALAGWALRRGGGGGRGRAESAKGAHDSPAGGPAARAYVERAFVLAAAFTVLLSPRYAWYFVWLVPFLPVVRPALVVPVFYLTAASFVLYRSWFGDSPEQMFALGLVMYLPFAALCLCAWLVTRLKPNAARRPAENFAE